MEKGETVILDNGAYEGVQTAPFKLNQWVRELRPAVVVLPDAPGRLAQTLFKAEDYLSRFGLPTGTEGMTVLHAPDGKLEQFIMAYTLVQTKWVGFSRLTKAYSDTMKWPYHRCTFAVHLRACNYWRPELEHHALGMLNGNLHELRSLNQLGFHSCDSSAPIWRGLHGYEVNDSDWPNYELTPLVAPEVSNWEMADRNLKTVIEACHG